MLVKNLSFEALPHLVMSDPIHYALDLMQDNHVWHLAVTDDHDQYQGLVNERMLLEAGDDIEPVSTLKDGFQNLFVKEDEHFLKAVELAAAKRLSVVPVTDTENNLAGSIESTLLLQHISNFMQLDAPGAIIVLEVSPRQYSFSEISKIVETNDAQIIQLNTAVDAITGLMLVTLRINKLEVSDVVATFQRYDYAVKYYFGEELYTNELKDNYENLMNYLNI